MWCEHKEDAFEVLASRWIGEDPDFEAVSKRNKKNRGSMGTHSAGSRNHGLFKKHLVYTYMEQPAFISYHVIS